MSKNVFTLSAMADWAEAKADEIYDWTNSYTCACAQYGESLGIERADIWNSAVDNPNGFWQEANVIAFGRPHTFKALAERLRAATKA